MTTTLLERTEAIYGSVSPEAIEIKIAEATNAIPALQDAVGDAAWIVEQTPNSGAREALATARAALRAGHERIEDLGAALKRARAAEDNATEATREKLRQSQRAAVREHLALRDAAGARLADAMAVAVQEWRALVQHTEDMTAACPLNEDFPTGVSATLNDLQQAVFYELWRIGADTENPYRNFPGIRYSNLDHQYQPNKSPGLVQTLENNARTIQRLVINVKGKSHE